MRRLGASHASRVIQGGPQMRKASVVAGSIAAATAGSAIFGGIALASNCPKYKSEHKHHSAHHSSDHNTRGGDGYGGNATNNCLNVGAPILSGIGVGGSGSADGASCTANANGSGGNAY